MTRGVLRPVVPEVYRVKLGVVSAYLVDVEGDLTLIDTGSPGSAERVLQAIRGLGHEPGDLRDIVVTHAHIDHAGSLADLRAVSGATVWMHHRDAVHVRRGVSPQEWRPAPGPVNALMYHLFLRDVPDAYPPAVVDREVGDGETVPVAGGMRVVLTPGHTSGHIALLWPREGGVLFAGDAATHMAWLSLSLNHQEVDAGRRSLERIARLDFETACFAHGRPMVGGAAAAFRRRWGASGR